MTRMPSSGVPGSGVRLALQAGRRRSRDCRPERSARAAYPIPRVVLTFAGSTAKARSKSLAIPSARELVGCGSAFQPRVQTRRMKKVAADVLHDVDRRRNPVRPAGRSQISSTPSDRKRGLAGKRAYGLRFKTGRIVVGNQKHVRLRLRRALVERPQKRSQPSRNLAGTVSREGDTHRGCGRSCRSC